MNYNEDVKPFKVKYRVYITPVILALIVTMFWRPMSVDGNSMKPTLEDGQIIIIAKEQYSAKRGAPKLYDIVAFIDDFFPTDMEGEHSAARVVGLPGDTIEIKDGKVFRNKEELKEPYATGETKEELKLKLKEDEVFVLCDNRENSVDSRNPKVGPVKMSALRGHLALRVWPINEVGGVKIKANDI